MLVSNTSQHPSLKCRLFYCQWVFLRPVFRYRTQDNFFSKLVVHTYTKPLVSLVGMVTWTPMAAGSVECCCQYWTVITFHFEEDKPAKCHPKGKREKRKARIHRPPSRSLKRLNLQKRSFCSKKSKIFILILILMFTRQIPKMLV